MKKILIVEDKADVRMLLSATLPSGDYEILQAGDGESGIEAARAHKPAVILMDVMMPGRVDGLEATRRIRQDPDLAAIPILMLSARAQNSDISLGLAAGANDYVTKPFSPLDLVRKIEALTEGA